MSKKDTFYITTPIYYASGLPHLGHAYTSIACDVLARWNRNLGKDVFFMTGTDEHGQKVAKNAAKKKVTPKEFVDDLIPEFKNLLKVMNISNDYFIRTTDEKHKKFVQKMLQKSYDAGDIYKDTYEGLYCVDCERYYKEDELIEGKICPDHKREVTKMKEENYFFRLSKYEKKLLDLYKKNPEFLSPFSKAQETINRVKEGLQDISISRHKNSLDWGIELPFDKDHVTYVWFDALFNYVSGLEINKKSDFWPANVHVVGKDIMWFHKVYWPAFLMSVGMDLPKKVFAHGWWTVDGEKMGKSMGNVIEPVEVAQKYGVDEFRYFVMSVGTFGDDLDFSYSKFAEKINNELNNDLGNLVSRVHAMTGKYFAGSVPAKEIVTEEEINLISSLDIFDRFDEHMQKLEFNKALELLWGAIRETNAYINRVAPWKEQDMKRLSTIINVLVFSVKVFSFYIDSFMPSKAQRLREQFNFTMSHNSYKEVSAGHKLGEKDNLFEKIQISAKTAELKIKGSKAEVSLERQGFATLDLRVGKIISVENHPDSEKMFVETIDVGEEKPRQIVSGLRSYYNLDEMKNRKVIVVCNLKPAKLRGVKSEGMVLVSELDDDSNVGLLGSDAKVGEYLSCAGKVANSSSRVKVEKFFEMDFKSDGKKVFFDGKEVSAGGKNLSVDRGIKGKIC